MTITVPISPYENCVPREKVVLNCNHGSCLMTATSRGMEIELSLNRDEMQQLLIAVRAAVESMEAEAL
jgi:hypothetical protein